MYMYFESVAVDDFKFRHASWLDDLLCTGARLNELGVSAQRALPSALTETLNLC